MFIENVVPPQSLQPRPGGMFIAMGYQSGYIARTELKRGA